MLDAAHMGRFGLFGSAESALYFDFFDDACVHYVPSTINNGHLGHVDLF